jgi:hypothetical protein
MRRGLLLTAVALAFGTATAGGGSAAETQNLITTPVREVVCITKPRAGFGRYRIRPHTCQFHRRGQENYDGEGAFAVFTVSHLRWLHWGHQVAVGLGRAGAGAIKVRLAIPFKTRCGHTVFSHARFTTRHGGSLSMPLDTILTAWDCPTSPAEGGP